jgi:hypothetical protein
MTNASERPASERQTPGTPEIRERVAFRRKNVVQQSEKNSQDQIERFGAGGEVGKGQSGTPLHRPRGVRDRELGKRERVGAGGPIGQLDANDKKDRDNVIDSATHEIVEDEIRSGDATPAADPDQKNE